MSFIKKQGFFLVPFLALLIVAISFIQITTQKELHLLLNSYHTESLDNIFYWITYLGDGRVFFFVPVLLVLTTLRKTIFVFSATAIASIATQIIKRIMQFPRPSKVFEEGELYIVNGMNLHQNFSFPSGHTTTAFALFFSLSILKPKYAALFIVLAALSGFSRIYLSQHFLEDVVAGSLVGVCGVLIGLLINKRLKSDKLDRNIFGFGDKL